MNRRNIILASMTAVVLLGAISLITNYYDKGQAPNKRQKTAGQRQHGDGVRPLPCSQDVITSLRLLHDEQELWKKTHQELLSLPGSVDYGDRRFKGKRALPISVLMRGQENIAEIEAIPCDGKPVKINLLDKQTQPDLFVLAQNRRGRMKLLRKRKNKRFETLARNVIAIRLISSKTISSTK